MDHPKIGRTKKSDKLTKTRQKMGPYSAKWVRLQEDKLKATAKPSRSQKKMRL